jgi:hypothetical protein
MPIQRALLPPATAAVLALIFVAPVAAKVPYFSVELEPARPVAGEPITVTVRFWDDASHTKPATWSPDGSVDHLLAFVPPDGLAGDQVPVPLEPAGSATMRGTVTLPNSGSWTLGVFPLGVEPIPPGYPEPVVEVDVAAPSSPMPVAVASASAVVLLAAGVMLASRSQRFVSFRQDGT